MRRHPAQLRQAEPATDDNNVNVHDVNVHDVNVHDVNVHFEFVHVDDVDEHVHDIDDRSHVHVNDSGPGFVHVHCQWLARRLPTL